MSRIDDKIEELEEWRLQKEVADARKEERSLTIRTICVTATTAVTSSLLWLANFIYDKFDAVKAAVQAFVEAGHK